MIDPTKHLIFGFAFALPTRRTMHNLIGRKHALFVVAPMFVIHNQLRQLYIKLKCFYIYFRKHKTKPKQTMETLLFKLPTLYEVSIQKRPSQHCKTPYMADALTPAQEEWLIHTPSLGCCGLVDKESNVLVQENENKKTKSSHSVQLSIYREDHPTMGIQEVIIGVHPQLAETIVKTALEKDLIEQLKGHTHIETQKTYNESRLDFYGRTASNQEFYLEVKTVPLADYVDEPKQRNAKKGKPKNPKNIKKTEQKMPAIPAIPHIPNIDENIKPFHEKIAYFPDGYRKNPKDVISPRALKHVKELQHIVENTTARGILCFVVQRDDANVFQPSNIDPIYKEALYEAYEAGVEIIALQVKYTREGECYYYRQLPVRLQSTKNEEKEHTLL